MPTQVQTLACGIAGFADGDGLCGSVVAACDRRKLESRLEPVAHVNVNVSHLHVKYPGLCDAEDQLVANSSHKTG